MFIKLNLRTIVIILFLILYIGSILIINSFFLQQQDKFNQIIRGSKFDEQFSDIEMKTEKDSLKAKNLLVDFRGSIAAAGMIQKQNRYYSALFLLITLILAVTIFIIIFYKLTTPLNELQDATVQIRRGNFNITLPETGIPEMRQLKQSFNRMSKELDIIQKKLLESEKEMIWKELSRALAHEIKNPLTPIQLSIQRLEDKFATDENKFREIFPEAATIIHQEIENLRNLVKSFSTFAKTQEANKIQFNAKKYLNNIIKSYKQKYRVETELENIEIEFDKTHFYRIITNIIQNAIEASKENSKILVNLYKSKSFAVIEIKDFGKGMTTEEKEKIFEPYFSKKKKGTGLGLAIVKKLIDINNSYIRVHSEINQGTTFEIIIS